MPSQKQTPPYSFTAIVIATVYQQQRVSIDAGHIVQPSLAILEQCAKTCYVLYRQADNRLMPVERAAARWRAINQGIAATPALMTRTEATQLLQRQRFARRLATLLRMFWIGLLVLFRHSPIPCRKEWNNAHTP